LYKVEEKSQGEEQNKMEEKVFGNLNTGTGRRRAGFGAEK
jgi:hypothetical protein